MRAMSEQLIGALLLNFGAAAGAMLMRIPKWDQSRMSRQVGWILLLGGGLGGFFAIYLFIHELGWLRGLALWFGSDGLSALALGVMLEGLRDYLRHRCHARRIYPVFAICIFLTAVLVRTNRKRKCPPSLLLWHS